MNNTQAPFQPGQQVLRKIYKRGSIKPGYGAAFTIHIVHYDQMDGWVVLDKYLNKFRARDCVCASAYNSPLWEAMQEDES